MNGHWTNRGAAEIAASWAAGRPDTQVIFHEWWRAPRTSARIRAIDPVAGHGGWLQNLPWTRLANAPAPDDQKPEATFELGADLEPARVRRMLGDGSMGGYYERDDAEMMQLGAVMVQETRAVLDAGWVAPGEAAGARANAPVFDPAQMPRQLPSR